MLFRLTERRNVPFCFWSVLRLSIIKMVNQDTHKAALFTEINLSLWPAGWCGAVRCDVSAGATAHVNTIKIMEMLLMVSAMSKESETESRS